MGTQELSESVKSKIIGWKLIGEKYDGEDFNLGDEVVLNLFYDRSNARLNIIFSLNYGEPDCNIDPEQEVLLFRCFGLEELSCRIISGNDYINAISYKDDGDAVELIVDAAGMSFIVQEILVTKCSWSTAINLLTSKEKHSIRNNESECNENDH